MATDLNFELVTYTPEAPDAANFVLLDGVADPYPGFKLKILREVTGTEGQPGTDFKTKLLREERVGAPGGFANKILLECVDGDNEEPDILGGDEFTITFIGEPV